MNRKYLKYFILFIYIVLFTNCTNKKLPDFDRQAEVINVLLDTLSNENFNLVLVSQALYPVFIDSFPNPDIEATNLKTWDSFTPKSKSSLYFFIDSCAFEGLYYSKYFKTEEFNFVKTQLDISINRNDYWKSEKIKHKKISSLYKTPAWKVLKNTSEFDKIFDWNFFHEKYGDIILAFSKPVFNQKLNLCLVQFDLDTEKNSVKGVFILKFDENKWRIIKKFSIFYGHETGKMYLKNDVIIKDMKILDIDGK